MSKNRNATEDTHQFGYTARLVRNLAGLPSPIRRGARRLLREVLCSGCSEGMSISEAWEQYAKTTLAKNANGDGSFLGDEWTQADEIGIDVPEDQIISYLDNKIFEPFLKGCDVMLEIGSGGGRFTSVLLPKCKRLIATDTSPSMLSLLRRRFKDDEKIEYMQLDGKGLGAMPDASIDAAFSYGVFVHLQHWDIYNYLLEIRRVLKPDGRALIHHSNSFSELGWQRFNDEVPSSLDKPKLPGTFIFMTPDIMRDLVSRAGLTMEDCITDIVKRDCISLMRRPSQ